MFWACSCCTNLVTHRKFDTSNPPVLQQQWDFGKGNESVTATGFSIDVDSAGVVYNAGQTTEVLATPFYVRRWESDQFVPIWEYVTPRLAQELKLHSGEAKMAGCHQPTGSSAPSVFCIDTDGNELWTVNAGGSRTARHLIWDGDDVYVSLPTNTFIGGATNLVTKIDGTSGAVQWQTTYIWNTEGTPIGVAMYDGDPHVLTSQPLGGSSFRFRLLRFDATVGTKTQTGTTTRTSAIGVGASGIIVDNGGVIANIGDGLVKFNIDASLSEQWAATAEIAGQILMGDDGDIYMGGAGVNAASYLWRFADDGSLAYQHAIDGTTVGSGQRSSRIAVRSGVPYTSGARVNL